MFFFAFAIRARSPIHLCYSPIPFGGGLFTAGQTKTHPSPHRSGLVWLAGLVLNGVIPWREPALVRGSSQSILSRLFLFCFCLSARVCVCVCLIEKCRSSLRALSERGGVTYRPALSRNCRGRGSVWSQRS